MTGRLEGRVALVTGGGRGIGRAISEAFAREGASVGIVDLKPEIAGAAADEINASGGKAIGLVANVARRDEVFEAAEQVRAAFGPTTILVNNAMFNRYGSLLEQDEKTIGLMIDVGFKGVIWGYQAVVPQMEEAGGGSIINIASPAALIAFRHGIMYSAVKAAVQASTRSAAAEFGPLNIRVNAIAPGSTRTDGANLVVDEAGWERRRQKVPLGRLGEPEDIANAAVFLAGAESSWVSGDMMLVDGAMTFAFS
ncbi:glucose 1-dehydrogenase [Aquibium carbonis]|uniref:Glucose 1-dehydrogenase n=2 Tax=Aquibium carbonis TaxID=2495581 RepID=A0A3S0AAZ4_9HYPH|nr:glucose 1-dehydrogenase [Aquibium carbonis]